MHCKEKQYHRILADYFMCQPWNEVSVGKFIPNSRKCFELPKQLIWGGMFENACENLCSMHFLIAKMKADLFDDLLDDFDMAIKEIPEKIHQNNIITFSDFILSKSHIVSRGSILWPNYKIFFQLAIEYADDSPITIAAEKYASDGNVDWIYLRKEPRRKKPNDRLLRRVFETDEKTHDVFLDSNNQLYAYFSGTINTWNMHSGKKISTKGEIIRSKLQFLRTGNLLCRNDSHDLMILDRNELTCIKKMKGHTDWICGAFELPDGDIVSHSSDHTLRHWRARIGDSSVLHKFESYPRGHCIGADGNFFVWDDSTLFWWKYPELECLREWRFGWQLTVVKLSNNGLLIHDNSSGDSRLWENGKEEPISFKAPKVRYRFDVFRTTDGAIVQWGDIPADQNEKYIHVTNPVTKEWISFCENTDLEGESLNGVFELHDGNLCSYSSDGVLRVWDSKTGDLIVSSEKNGSVFRAMQVPGNRVVFEETVGAIKIWNYFDNSVVQISDHEESEKLLAINASGAVIKQTSDKRVEIFDVNRNARVADLVGHTAEVTGLKEIDENALLTWSFDDKSIRLWNTNLVEDPDPREYQAHTSSFLHFRVNKNRLLTKSSCRVILWDLNTLLPVISVKSNFGIGMDPVFAMDGAFVYLVDYKKNTIVELSVVDNKVSELKAEFDGKINRIFGFSKYLLIFYREGIAFAYHYSTRICSRFMEFTGKILDCKELSSGNILLRFDGSATRIMNVMSMTNLYEFEKSEEIIQLQNGRILLSTRDDYVYLDEAGFRCISRIKIKSDSPFVHRCKLSKTGIFFVFGGTEMFLVNLETGEYESILKCPINIVEVKDVSTENSWLLIVLENNDKFYFDYFSRSRAKVLGNPEFHSDLASDFSTFLENNDRSCRFAQITEDGELCYHAIWEGDSKPWLLDLFEDGRALAKFADGQLFYLQLFNGNKRISITELERISREGSR